MRVNHTFFINASLVALSLLAGFSLASSISFADENAIDDIYIDVPISCSLAGEGMDTHYASINPGTFNSNIGETTIKAFCNDNDGFAIYAVGFTNDTDGDNTLTSTTVPSRTISTGTGTSGDSQWAMRLATPTSPTPTYPISIQNDFDSFHTIPEVSTLVAKRTSSTDVGSNAAGSTLSSTYQVYVSLTQIADTYMGQVKYTLVHPNYVDSEMLQNAINIVFDGDGLTFPDGSTTNTVKYANVCKLAGYGYVGSNYREVMTSNIVAGGIKQSSYTASESVLQPITIQGADKLKVVVKYGIEADTAALLAIPDIFDGDFDNWNDDWDGYNPDTGEDNWIYSSSNNISGTKTYYINGDTTTIYAESHAAPETEYDFGFYVKVYPVYDTEQPNTTREAILDSDDCTLMPISGAYAETDPWHGIWTTRMPYEYEDCYWDDDLQEDVCTTGTDYDNYEFYNEDDIVRAIEDNQPSAGSTFVLKAYNPYTLRYDGNEASNEFGMGIHYYSPYEDEYSDFAVQELSDGSQVELLAPNYKRSGYGFVGWSLDQNAASHISTATLYGPNETITISQAMLDAASGNHEVTLYATWVPSSGNLQNWSGCSNLGAGDVTALTDTRDSNVYAVAKLADGNCWMIENLRLGGNSSMTLTASDTQSAGTLPAATYGSGWASSGLQKMSNISTASPENIVENVNQKNYAFGNYYSWYAANNLTAQVSGNYDGNSSSICPVGWRLPNSTDIYSFSNYGIILLTPYPNNFIKSGLINVSTESNTFDNHARANYGSHMKQDGRAVGEYWLNDSIYSSYYGRQMYYSLMIDNSGYFAVYNYYNVLNYGLDGNHDNGFTVRCLQSSL